MTRDSERLRQTWETWAAGDPLFAILSDPTKLGGKWDIDEFMAHTPELDAVFETIEKHGLLKGRGRALDFGCGVGRMTQALADRLWRALPATAREGRSPRGHLGQRPHLQPSAGRCVPALVGICHR